MPRSIMETQKFTNLEKSIRDEKTEIITTVYKALKEKGYNPVNQIVGYLLSGDPTYITGYKNARSLITRMERDELLEEIVEFYVQENE